MKTFKFNYFYCAVIVALTLMLSSGCSHKASVEESAAKPNVIVNESDKGREISLSIGQVLVIQLEANPTTGYTWEFEGDSFILKQLDEPKFQSETDMVGAPGVQEFSFKVTGRGQEILNLVYHRPWEKDTIPAETFFITIRVN
ncbi:protease inhibitor I42 family protein [bacterium]|nr:protease inhibitor I42 family protein [bacterium]